MKREEMIKRYEDIVLNIHGKAGDEERADYILALCRITQLICQLYQPEQDTKWQNLKRWLNDRMNYYDDSLNENVLISSERQEVLSARSNQCYETIAQMEYIEKELEGEDDKD